jgi:hypothetical protein
MARASSRTVGSMTRPIDIEPTDAGQYRPGVCNIGPAEIHRRQQVGYAGLVATLGLGAALWLLRAPAVVRLVVALPAAISMSGFIQARSHFCAGFGMAGLQNFGALGDEVRVEDEAARAADRRRSMRINVVSTVGGIAVAVLCALLPGRP